MAAVASINSINQSSASTLHQSSSVIRPSDDSRRKVQAEPKPSTSLPTALAPSKEPILFLEGEVLTVTDPTTASSSTADAHLLLPPTAAAPLPPSQDPQDNPNPDADDYFGQSRIGHNLNLEPNPFEQSFSNSATETPGKNLLPSVASLTSPSALLPSGTPGWSNSLRAGPLSPAMLAGPAGTDYFSESHFRASFPTANESSLRTGLTPGGGGSMFPAPSPNTQASFNGLQDDGVTPSTLDFHRTALSAAAAAKSGAFAVSGSTVGIAAPAVTGSSLGSQLAESILATASNEQRTVRVSSPPPQPSQANQTTASNDPFGQHDTDAANGLYMLANGDGSRRNSQFTSLSQSSPTSSHPLSQSIPGQSPRSTTKLNNASSLLSLSGSIPAHSDTAEGSDSAHSDKAKPVQRSRVRKSITNKATGNGAGSRRKAEEHSLKTPAAKKSRKSVQLAEPEPNFDEDEFYSDDEDGAQDAERSEQGGKKLTDEEKRKNFLERNRVAALKCRQRKKQWLSNLQSKVELYSTENEALSTLVTQLREEVMSLKTLLIAHKDCAVSQAQGLSGIAMQTFVGDISRHSNPFNMAIHAGASHTLGLAGQGAGGPLPGNGMQRR